WRAYGAPHSARDRPRGTADHRGRIGGGPPPGRLSGIPSERAGAGGRPRCRGDMAGSAGQRERSPAPGRGPLLAARGQAPRVAGRDEPGRLHKQHRARGARSVLWRPPEHVPGRAAVIIRGTRGNPARAGWPAMDRRGISAGDRPLGHGAPDHAARYTLAETGDHPMAETAPISDRRLDSLLGAIEDIVFDLPEVIGEWETLSDAEQVSWSLDWDATMGSRLREVVSSARRGRLNPEQRRRLIAVGRALDAARSNLERLGLALPSVTLPTREPLRCSPGSGFPTCCACGTAEPTTGPTGSGWSSSTSAATTTSPPRRARREHGADGRTRCPAVRQRPR